MGSKKKAAGPKAQHEEGVRFARAAADAVQARGARRVDPPSEGYVLGYKTGTPRIVCAGVYAIETRFGELRVRPYGDWIKLTFMEPARAAGRMPKQAPVVDRKLGTWTISPRDPAAWQGSIDLLAEVLDEIRAAPSQSAQAGLGLTG